MYVCMYTLLQRYKLQESIVIYLWTIRISYDNTLLRTRIGVGLCPGIRPQAVESITAVRNATDMRQVHVTWQAAAGAEFYIVRIGLRADAQLGQSFQVYGGRCAYIIRSLDAQVATTGYFVSVDSVSASGITLGKVVKASVGV